MSGDLTGLCLCMYYPDNMICYRNIHRMNNKALPEAFRQYKNAIQLFKLYNSDEYTYDWTILNFNQTFTSRQTTFMAFKSNKTQVGINLMANRMSALNGKIPFDWLNQSLTSFKVKCKRLFLTY